MASRGSNSTGLTCQFNNIWVYSIANQDTRSAEQATMALDTIFLCYEKQAGSHPAVRAAIDALFQEVNNPSAYNAPRFSSQMHKVNAALRDSGITVH